MRPRGDGPLDGKPLRFASNQEMHQAYLAYVRQVHSTSTLDKAFTEVRKFLDYFGDRLAMDLSLADLIAYVEVYEAQCTHFRRGGLKPRGQPMRPNWCAKKQPLACQGCPLYEGMKAVTTEHHLTSIAGLYSWLADKQHIENNRWAVVLRRWRTHNKRRLKKEVSARRLTKRFLKATEMVRLIEGTPTWTWKIVTLLGAKYFLRAGELARLKVTPKYLDPELNWIIVPMATGNDGKRIVAMPFPIDPETRRYLRAYLRWRQEKLRRCHRDFEELIIHKNCQPFRDTKHIGGNLTAGLRRNANKVGLENLEYFRSHCLRRFGSDRAQSLGVIGNELKLVRGDWVETDATGAYLDTQRLAEIYAKACPPLGLRDPPESFPLEGRREGFPEPAPAAA
jgi:hypothetical protein